MAHKLEDTYRNWEVLLFSKFYVWGKYDSFGMLSLANNIKKI